MYVTLDTLSLLESNPFHVIRAKENDVFDCGVENGFCKTDIHDTLIKRILIGKHSLEL
jgi:hypothetical protein